MQAPDLRQLVELVIDSPVFGDSFNPNLSVDDMMHQMAAVAHGLDEEIVDMVAPGTPELSRDQVRRNAAKHVLESVAFCPAIAAGEITDLPRLRAAAKLTFIGFWADRAMDTGDPLMPLAIQVANGRPAYTPEREIEAVASRVGVLQQNRQLARQIARSKDRRLVAYVGNDESLTAQVDIYELTIQFNSIAPDDLQNQQKFLNTNRQRIARALRDGAGAPCAITPMYALYRQYDPSLPPLEKVYQTPHLQRLLRVANGLVRVCDDRGDYVEDDASGSNPALNLFNQSHSGLVRSFCQLAGMRHEPTVEALIDAFKHFHTNDDTRRKNGAFITNTFRDHVVDYFGNLPAHIQREYSRFILLGKRTLEAAWVSGLPR